MWSSPKRARRWPIWAAVAAVLAVIVLAVMGATRFTWLSSLLTTVVSPVQQSAHHLSARVTGYFRDRIYRRDLEAEYVKLREMAAELQMENDRIPGLQKENAELRALLGYAETIPEQETIYADVTGRNPDSWFSTLTINCGAAQGVRKWSAVVCPQGLIGVVTEVRRNSSVVRTIIDGSSAVSGVVERTRDGGMVKGNMYMSGDADPCRMVYLPFEAELVPGDTVVTSGLEGKLPKGLLIGAITDVSRGRQTADAYVVVQPAADIRRVERVLVILNTPGALEEETAAQDATATSATPTGAGQ